MGRIIIGLSGYAGVGKDTVANMLLANKDDGVKVSFAAPLKTDLQPIFDRLGININERADKEKVRPLLVEYGKTARAIHPDYWVARAGTHTCSRVAYSDVRYVNEALHIQQQGGLVIYINRDGFVPANPEEKASFEEMAKAVAEGALTRYAEVHMPEGDPVACVEQVRALIRNTFGEEF